MKSTYKPKYAKGQIIVAFKKGCYEEFVKTFGSAMGYSLVGEWKPGNNTFIYNTPVRKENTACRRFEKYYEFVEWAVKRDLKYESRFDKLDKIVVMLEDVRDCFTSFSDKKYNKDIEEVMKRIKKIKA